MLKWLATLSYRSIEERISEFINDPALVGENNNIPEPVKEPKQTIFKVSEIALQNLFTF